MSGVRKAVAGDKWYSADPTRLVKQLTACLARPAPGVATPPPLPQAQAGRILKGLIVPHGSLQDSGYVAAAAYKLLGNALAAVQEKVAAGAAAASAGPSTLHIIILGTNHFSAQPPACLSGSKAWETPLGRVAVDQELTKQLQAAGLPVDDGPHSVEHSIENQLPFLQHVMPAAKCGFDITPICVGGLSSLAQADQLAALLASTIDRHPAGSILLVATSDFTHAGIAYDEQAAASWMSLREHCLWQDSPILHSLCTNPLDPPAAPANQRPASAPGSSASDGGGGGGGSGSLAASFLRACASTQSSLCGMWPVAVFLRVADRLGWGTQLLSYAPSDLYYSSGSINGFASLAAWGH